VKASLSYLIVRTRSKPSLLQCIELRVDTSAVFKLYCGKWPNK